MSLFGCGYAVLRLLPVVQLLGIVLRPRAKTKIDGQSDRNQAEADVRFLRLTGVLFPVRYGAIHEDFDHLLHAVKLHATSRQSGGRDPG